MSFNDVGGVRRLRSKIRSCFYANELPQNVWICRTVFWGVGFNPQNLLMGSFRYF